MPENALRKEKKQLSDQHYIRERDQFLKLILILDTPTRNLPYPSVKDFLTSIIKKSDIDKLHINTVNFVAVNVSL